MGNMHVFMAVLGIILFSGFLAAYSVSYTHLTLPTTPYV